MSYPILGKFKLAIVMSVIKSLCIAAILFSLVNIELHAQERRERRGGREGRSRFDPVEYVKGLDKNRNGMLEPSEVSGRTAGWLQRMGFDTEESNSVEKVLSRMDDERRNRTSQREESSSSSVSALKVPGFGASDSGSAVPAFGLSSVTPLTTSFSEDVERQVEESLVRYDSNKNGMLDRDEIKKGRWGNPRPEESDTNGDGKLSRIELANRYYAREQYRRESESRSSGDDARRNDVNRRDDGRRRSSPSASSSRTFTPSGSRSSSSGRSGSRYSSGNSSTVSRSSSSSSGSRSSSSSDSREKYAKYAASLIKNYDKDEDGKLSKEEVKKMRRPPIGADADSDGVITKDELIDSLTNNTKATVSGGSSKDSKTEPASKSDSKEPSGSGSRSKSSIRSSGSFSDLDSNADNRVEMHEFSKDWDDEKVAEFYEKDKNGDGVITLREWSEKK